MRDIIVFGSSSSEVFDYIFGNNPQYYPFWASGWSARGLRNLKKSNEDMKPYIPYLETISKDANIFLHFGNVDIDFNLPYKMHHQHYYDIPRFLNEMCEGLLEMKKFLNRMGFSKIFAVFTAPPTALKDDYWDYPPLPYKVRGKLMLDFANRISEVIPTINCLYALIDSNNNPISAPRFVRNNPDHHLDYIKAQEIVYNHINNIEGMLKMRIPKHKELYEHLGYAPDVILKTGKPRPRTCR
ncbi:hypothetical protein X781_780 [Mannheimia sp. USDA-ARS-USMARC-1261]|uniref:hypothetical protein n=1 Tax=Mannheimia TaxID=75984 RepID=UPI0003E36E04|nr:hypothetical protein [Mannheimia sp. USDA-ARS-USMARC-1261]AHG72228.1 hypothetical protein X781_780 [Mannheimia sp. USDA-ARS-USMARC-1261]